MKEDRPKKRRVYMKEQKWEKELNRVKQLDARLGVLLDECGNYKFKALKIALKNEKNIDKCITKLSLFAELCKKDVIWSSYDYTDITIKDLQFLNNIDYEKVDEEYVYSIFSSEELRENDLTYQAIELLQETNKTLIDRFVTKVLTSELAIESDVAMSGAKVLNKFESELGAYYAAKILTNPDIIASGIAVSAAELFKQNREMFIYDYAYEVLKSPYTIEAGLALDGAKEVFASPNEYRAYFISKVLTSYAALKQGIALDGAKLINESKNGKNSISMWKILTESVVIERGIAIAAAKILDECLDVNGAKEVCWYIIDNINEPKVLEEAKKLVELFNFEYENKVNKEKEVPFKRVRI